MAETSSNWPPGFPKSRFPLLYLPPEIRQKILVFALKSDHQHCIHFGRWWKAVPPRLKKTWGHASGVNLEFAQNTNLKTKYFVLQPLPNIYLGPPDWGISSWGYCFPQSRYYPAGGLLTASHAWANCRKNKPPSLDFESPSIVEAAEDYGQKLLSLVRFQHKTRRLPPTNLVLVSRQLYGETVHALWSTTTLVVNLAATDVRKRWADVPSASGRCEVPKWFREGTRIPPVPRAAKQHIQSLVLIIRRQMAEVEVILKEVAAMILNGSLRSLDVRFDDRPCLSTNLTPSSYVEGLIRMTRTVSTSRTMEITAALLADPDLRERGVYVSRKHRGGWCQFHNRMKQRQRREEDCGLRDQDCPGAEDGGPGGPCTFRMERSEHGTTFVGMDAGEGNDWLELDCEFFVKSFGKPEECRIYRVDEWNR